MIYILKGVRTWESNDILHVSTNIFRYKQRRHTLANLGRRGIYSRLLCCLQIFWEGWRSRLRKRRDWGWLGSSQDPRNSWHQRACEDFQQELLTSHIYCSKGLAHLFGAIDSVVKTEWVYWLAEPGSYAPNIRAKEAGKMSYYWDF